MRDVVVELWDGERKIATRQYQHHLTAAELKTALAQENKDWTGILQKSGSSTLLNGGRRLVTGVLHHFRLQNSCKHKHPPAGWLFTPAVKADHLWFLCLRPLIQCVNAEEIMNAAKVPVQGIRRWGNY